jgi:hypothetical protein
MAASAQQNSAYNPATGYGASATGLAGSASRSALHDLIDGHSAVTENQDLPTERENSMHP